MKVFPKPQTVIYLKLQSPDSKNDLFLPSSTTVLQVRRGALTVPEWDSINGLAQIVCTANSGNDGVYWYEYTDKKGKGFSSNVLGLYTETGQSIMCFSFISE